MNQTPFFCWTFIIVSNWCRGLVGFIANLYAVFIKRTYASRVLTCPMDISSTQGWDGPAGVLLDQSDKGFTFSISTATRWHFDFKWHSTCEWMKQKLISFINLISVFLLIDFQSHVTKSCSYKKNLKVTSTSKLFLAIK